MQPPAGCAYSVKGAACSSAPVREGGDMLTVKGDAECRAKLCFSLTFARLCSCCRGSEGFATFFPAWREELMCVSRVRQLRRTFVVAKLTFRFCQ